MRKTSTTRRTDCKKFLQLSILCVVVFLISSSSFAGLFDRAPASSVPDEEVLTAPYDQKVFIQSLLAEDDAGVLIGIRNTLLSYQQTEDYAKMWHLESTGLYSTPDVLHKQHFIAGNILNYADKRLAGEIRRAEAGSSLESIGKAEQALRPNAEVGVSKNISLKLKVHVLQGNAVAEVKNPWLEANASVSSNGKLRLMTRKEFKQIGFCSGAEFNFTDGDSVIYSDQQLTKNIKARASTIQVNHQRLLSNDADKRLELMATFPFNL